MTEEMESLIVQRKTLSKGKESVSRDLDKIRREYETYKKEQDSNLLKFKYKPILLIKKQTIISSHFFLKYLKNKPILSKMNTFLYI